MIGTVMMSLAAIDNFRFANPDASWILWLVFIVVGVLVWLDWRRSDVLSRLVSPLMQKQLVSQPTVFRRRTTIGLLGLSAVCFVIALMRPQYGLAYIKSPRVGAQIMFCLDVSKSMLAEDTAPNRLGRAKADITDLLSFLDGDQVGLIGFAGRASVLCPLTPDYGFFKMILESAGPSSVGRGGTRLEEPLRKALDGFRSESDVSRVVFLITDGEDHDSHPLDVAKDAIERGINVVAVGLGDETGSEIRITDPRTGVQSVVRDQDGNPVSSRLDGETLRELALATEGVYIPAGTGSLDLKSIYDAHLKPLVRGEMQTQGRAIRNEAFQWAVLAGLGVLIIAIAVGSGRPDSADDTRQDESLRPRTTAPRTKTSVAAVLIAGLICSLSFGQTHAAESSVTDPKSDSKTVGPQSRTAQSQAAHSRTAEGLKKEADENEEPNPRDLYNQGLAELNRSIGADLETAEKQLTRARLNAAKDGEVRFRATYNLGLVEIRKADRLLESEPEEALKQLQRAAGWFRDTIRLRSDADDARHNLEVVLQRILQLRDQLAQNDEQDLAGKLDALIESQRSAVSATRGLLEQVARSDDANVVDQFRSQFSRLAVQQRVAGSDIQGVVEVVGAELDSLDVSDEEASPEDQVRSFALSEALGFLNQASQRVAQSRSQLRRRQASRGFRRASAGLSQLKRARDQLRTPMEWLDGLLADAATTMQHTAQKSMEKPMLGQLGGEGSETPSIDVPVWIDQDFLDDSQSDLTQRCEELVSRLTAGLDSESTDGGTEGDVSAEQQAFREQLKTAMPYLNKATEELQQAGQKIALSEYTAAVQRQIAAIESLQEAREQFADLRALIELVHATESEIGAAAERYDELVSWGKVEGETEIEESIDEKSGVDEKETQSETGEDRAGEDRAGEDRAGEVDSEELIAERESILGYASEQQQKNATRIERLQKLIGSETEKLNAQAAQQSEGLPADTAAADTAGVPTTEPSPEMQRMKIAAVLAKKVSDQMQSVAAAIGKQNDLHELDGEDPASEQPSGDRLSKSVDETLETIQELRRLFFSIVEHLKDTAQRQVKLNDETEELAGRIAEKESASADLTGGAESRLVATQQEIQSIAEQIAKALREQSELPAQAEDSGQSGNAGQQDAAQDAAETAGKAADLVDDATEKMQTAVGKLQTETSDVASAREPQDEALQKLAEAIALLEPPQEKQQDQQQNQQQDQSDSGQQDSQQQQPNQQDQPQQNESEQPSEDEPQMDPSQVLQAVRDREAQRRKDKEERQAVGRFNVEKDW